MDFELALIVIGGPVVYLAGILTHKYAVDQAEKVKAHVTAEIQEVRADAAELRTELRNHVTELLDKLKRV